MTLYKPLVVVVPADVHDRLVRLADDLELEMTNNDDPALGEIRALCAKNGWNFDMLALGAWFTKQFDARVNP